MLLILLTEKECLFIKYSLWLRSLEVIQFYSTVASTAVLFRKVSSSDKANLAPKYLKHCHYLLFVLGAFEDSVIEESPSIYHVINGIFSNLLCNRR